MALVLSELCHTDNPRSGSVYYIWWYATPFPEKSTVDTYGGIIRLIDSVAYSGPPSSNPSFISAQGQARDESVFRRPSARYHLRTVWWAYLISLQVLETVVIIVTLSIWYIYHFQHVFDWLLLYAKFDVTFKNSCIRCRCGSYSFQHPCRWPFG